MGILEELNLIDEKLRNDLNTKRENEERAKEQARINEERAKKEAEKNEAIMKEKKHNDKIKTILEGDSDELDIPKVYSIVYKHSARGDKIYRTYKPERLCNY